jgi:putative component of toxin-antitoxin plasmid stabilization module
MPVFYFNHESLPACTSEYDFKTKFADSFKAFIDLTEEDHLGIDIAIVTEELPSKMKVFGDMTLLDAMDGISDRKLKELAYKAFSKYPIDGFIPWEDYEDELDFWFMKVGGRDLAAFHNYVISEINETLFSIPFHSDLICDRLPLSKYSSHDVSNDTPVLKKASVRNFYGSSTNYSAIQKELLGFQIDGLERFERVLALTGNSEAQLFEPNFRREFEGLSEIEQDSIISYLNKAIDRSLQSKFYPDTKIIAETKGKDRLDSVCELRIYQPSVLRVYFREEDNKVYLAKIGGKTSGSQTKDIHQAQKIVVRLKTMVKNQG